MHACKHAHINFIIFYKLTHIHTHSHAHTLACMQIRAYTYTPTHTHTHTHNKHDTIHTYAFRKHDTRINEYDITFLFEDMIIAILIHILHILYQNSFQIV